MAERHRRAGAIARAAFVASLLLAASPAVSSGAQDEDAAQRTAGAMPWSALDADEQRMLAIDAARFHLRNGDVIAVLDDWDERERGGAPCPVRASEDRPGRILRSVVCRAVERDLFQVVLTPHHDLDHQNHVHLEVVPGIDWSYVR